MPAASTRGRSGPIQVSTYLLGGGPPPINARRMDMRTYRASSLGSCTRAQIAAQLGMAPVGTPDKLAAMYQRGVEHEAECLAAMAVDGWKFAEPTHDSHIHGVGKDDGQWYVTLDVAGTQVTGHLDGVAGQRDDEWNRVIEIKSPFSWQKWETAQKTGDYSDPLMNRYAWQISVYMAATGLEAVVACVQDGQVRTFGIETPPYDRTAIEDRVARMEYGVDHPEYHPLNTMACSQVDGWACPYRYLCDDRPDTRDDAALDTLMGIYGVHKGTRDEADAAMKEMARQIDAHLGVEDTIRTETGTATRVTRQGSVSIDWKAAEADGVDLGEYKKVGKPSTFVKVTPREVDGDPSDA